MPTPTNNQIIKDALDKALLDGWVRETNPLFRIEPGKPIYSNAKAVLPVVWSEAQDPGSFRIVHEHEMLKPGLYGLSPEMTQRARAMAAEATKVYRQGLRALLDDAFFQSHPTGLLNHAPAPVITKKNDLLGIDLGGMTQRVALPIPMERRGHDFAYIMGSPFGCWSCRNCGTTQEEIEDGTRPVMCPGARPTTTHEYVNRADAEQPMMTDICRICGAEREAVLDNATSAVCPGPSLLQAEQGGSIARRMREIMEKEGRPGWPWPADETAT